MTPVANLSSNTTYFFRMDDENVFDVTGHAICGGYIDSIDTTLNDWPLIKDTLYSKKTPCF